MGVVALWAELRDSFLAENKDELKALICDLYSLDAETFHSKYIVLVSHKGDKGVMYLCPVATYKAHEKGFVPIADLPRIGTMAIDYSEPCLTYELDDFDNSLL